MKTNPNDPTSPTTEIGINGEVVQGFGFTKREHIAIEFTKALASSESFINQYIEDNGVYGDTFKGIVKNGLALADELIKQLNKDEK